jgi:hypothetical protein
MSVLADKQQPMEKDGGPVAEIPGQCLGDDEVAEPSAAVPLERWNYPRSNLYRIGATFFSFLVLGANDAAYGVSPVPGPELTTLTPVGTYPLRTCFPFQGGLTDRTSSRDTTTSPTSSSRSSSSPPL